MLEAASLKAAFSTISDGQIAAIVTELKLPDGDGLTFWLSLRRMAWNARSFLLQLSELEFCDPGYEDGCADSTKPVSAKDLTQALNTAWRRLDQQHGRQAVEASAQTIPPHNVVSGVSRAMRELYSLVERVAPYGGNVLICGESGSGKEVIAREIHRLSPRRRPPVCAGQLRISF